MRAVFSPTTAICLCGDCLERLVCEVTDYVLSGILNPKLMSEKAGAAPRF